MPTSCRYWSAQLLRALLGRARHHAHARTHPHARTRTHTRAQRRAAVTAAADAPLGGGPAWGPDAGRRGPRPGRAWAAARRREQGPGPRRGPCSAAPPVPGARSQHAPGAAGPSPFTSALRMTVSSSSEPSCSKSYTVSRCEWEAMFCSWDSRTRRVAPRAGRGGGGGGGPARGPRAGASTGLRGNRPGAVGGKGARRPPPGPAPPGNGGRPPDWSWCLGCPYQLRPAHDVLPGEMLAGELLLTLLLHQPGRQEAGLAHHGRQHVGDAARARQHQPGRRMCHGPGNPLGPQGGSAGRTSAPGASWVPGAPAPPPPRARRRGARRGPQLAARHSQAPLPPRLPPGCRGHH